MGACRFVLLSHDTFGRAGPAAFDLLNSNMRLRSLRQVLGLCPTTFFHGERHARSVQDPVLRDHEASPRHCTVAGVPVPTDDLVPVAGWPS